MIRIFNPDSSATIEWPNTDGTHVLVMVVGGWSILCRELATYIPPRPSVLENERSEFSDEAVVFKYDMAKLTCMHCRELLKGMDL